MKSREQVLQSLRAALPDIRARYPVGRVEPFGSYSRGEQTPASDLDLAVEFTGELTYRQQVALGEELTAAVGVRVDLSDRDGLKQRVRERVEREALAL